MNNISKIKNCYFSCYNYIISFLDKYVLYGVYESEARELQQILGYKEWRYFSAVIEKAQIAC